jgi:hypothetical protein
VEGRRGSAESRRATRRIRRRGIDLGLGTRLAFGLALSLPLAAAFAPPLSAQTPSIFRNEFWAELPSMPEAVQGSPEATARAILLADAAYVFAGEIWGFSFDWTPQDNARNIAETFSLAPSGRIGPDDPLLAVGKGRSEGERLLAYVSYSPDSSQVLRSEARARAPWKSAQGMGKSAWKEDFASREAAYADAARAAIRELLRGEEANKPRRVKGNIAFASPPRIWIADGLYVVQARFKVEVVELSPYEVY